MAWAGILLLALWSAIDKIRLSGAVPPAEFAAAVGVYAALPALLAAALLLCALSLRRRLLFGTPVAMAAPLFPPLLLFGAGGMALQALGKRAPPKPAATLPHPSAAAVLRTAIVLAALASLSMLLLGLIESLVYTSRFVPRLVEPAILNRYRLALGGLSFFSGVFIGVVGAALLLACSLASRGRPQSLSRLLGLLVAGVPGLLVWLALSDELKQIGIVGEFALMTVVLGVGAGGRIGRRVPVGDTGEHTIGFAERFFRYSVLPPVPRHTLATVGAGLAVLGALTLLLYPTLEDFRAEVFDVYAMLAVLLGAFLLRLVLHVDWRTAGVCLAVMFVLTLTVSRDARVRQVAHEYSRLGAVAANGWIEHRLDRFPRIGQAPTDAFSFHTAGGERLAANPAPLDRPLIIMLIWDGARPDHCSAFGYDRPTTPHLARLARESIVFTNAYSNATATTAAVRMLLSGRYATRFMLAKNYEPFVVKELAALGYTRFLVTVTGTDHNGVSLESFSRGWDTGDVAIEGFESNPEDREKPDRPKTRYVISQLAQIGDGKGVFIYLHLTGTHFPWFRTDFGSTVRDRYDSETRECDRLLGELLEALGDRECVLVMTADHGTGLGEHGRVAGFLPYEEQIRVPLLMRVPGRRPQRIDARVAHIDVAPTLANLLTSGGAHRFHGRSLLPLMDGKALEPRALVSCNAFRDGYAVLDGRWKLHHDRGRRYEALYDLKADPAERNNRIVDEPAVATRLRGLLDSFLWSGRKSYANPYHYRDWDGP